MTGFTPDGEQHSIREWLVLQNLIIKKLPTLWTKKDNFLPVITVYRITTNHYFSEVKYNTL